MEKRVVIAIVICVGILFGWMKLFPPPTPPPQKATPSADNSAAATAPETTAPSGATAGTTAGGTTTGAAAPAGPAAVNRPEEQVELLTPSVRFVLSSHGGTLRQAQLREAKYLLRKGDPQSGLELVT